MRRWLPNGRQRGNEYLAGTAAFQDDVAYRALVYDFFASAKNCLTNAIDFTALVGVIIYIHMQGFMR